MILVTKTSDQTRVCVCFLPIHSGHQVRWSYQQPGSHRRKVTQDYSSTFFLRCVPSFFSREGFSHSFPSSTVKSNFVYYNDLIVLHPLGIFILFFSFFSEKNPVCRDRTHVPTCQRVIIRGTSELPGRPAFNKYTHKGRINASGIE